MNAREEWITLRVPATAEYVDLVRITLYGVAAKMGFPYEEIEDMKVAISEACNNAVLHAYGDRSADGEDAPPDMRPHIDIRFIRKDDALSIVVKDDGRSFDAMAVASHASPMQGRTVDELQTGGLGLYLMQALMDQVEVYSEAGTEVVLTKRLTRSEDPI